MSSQIQELSGQMEQNVFTCAKSHVVAFKKAMMTAQTIM
jgi:hypothetical protein